MSDGILSGLTHYGLSGYYGGIVALDYPTQIKGALLRADDVREALLSDKTVKAVLAAQREHVIKSVGRTQWNDSTDLSRAGSATHVEWESWWCLGCKESFDSRQEADEHPIRMGLAALAGGDQ